MVEERNNLLRYLLDAPKERIFCREMDKKKQIHEFTFGDMISAVSNFGQHLRNMEDLGKHIPLFMDTSYDFLRTFLAILAAQKVCIPIHTIANSDGIEFILNKVEVKCIVVTQKRLYNKLVEIPYVREHIHAIFTTQEVIAEKSLDVLHVDIHKIFDQKIASETAIEFIKTAVNDTHTDDTMQIVFTSGTTGEPKGAILTHRNVVSCVVRAGNHMKAHSGLRSLTFLPLSHVMAQNEVFISLVVKATVQFVGRENLLHGLKTMHPNTLVVVPRVYQAIYQGIQRKLRNKPRARKLIDFVVRMHLLSRRGKNWMTRLWARVFSITLGRLITSKIRRNLGNFDILVTAGAACPPHIYDFYEAIGMPLTNAQGLTEVSGAVIYNDINETLDGSIGYPLPGVEVKIDVDGEILMKGDPVFKGYYKDAELTKKSFTPDGWFRTGDLGTIKMIRNKSYLFLIGRKKEILVLSSGLNIPAVQIEDRLVRHNLIHQVMVIGDGKPQLAALIVLNDEERKHHLPNGQLRGVVSKIIRQVNSELVDASEHIGTFEILPEPFTIENGMLTPTLKIRRPAVCEHYQKLIGRMYKAS